MPRSSVWPSVLLHRRAGGRRAELLTLIKEGGRLWKLGWPIPSLLRDHYQRSSTDEVGYYGRFAGAASVSLVVGRDVPIGTRVAVALTAQDGGTVWAKTLTADSVRPHLAGWVPQRRGNTLTATETFPDGGSCVAVGPMNAKDDEEFAVVFVERLNGGRNCRLADSAPWSLELSAPRTGDFPPYAPPLVNQPPKGR